MLGFAKKQILEGDFKMKMQTLSKFTFTALLATQVLSFNIAEAKLPKLFTKYKTHDIAALENPYFQIKSYKVKELSKEEVLELNRAERNNDFKFNSKMNAKISQKIKLSDIDTSATDKAAPDKAAPATPAPATPAPDTTPTPTSKGFLDNVIMVVDKLVAIGEKLAPIVKAGKSVVTNNPMSTISVLPRTDLKDYAVYEMGGWSVPVSKHYKVSFKNGWGSEVVTFIYSVSFQYNGRANGKGQYLTGVRATAREIRTVWGFDLDASSQLIQISNVGTQEDVIAGATLEMTYVVKNWLSTNISSDSFHVTGDGEFYKLD